MVIHHNRLFVVITEQNSKIFLAAIAMKKCLANISMVKPCPGGRQGGLAGSRFSSLSNTKEWSVYFMILPRFFFINSVRLCELFKLRLCELFKFAAVRSLHKETVCVLFE